MAGKMGRNKREIVEILMNRDDMSERDASSLFEETRELLDEAFAGGGEDPEQILLDQLGLESDYVFNFI